MIFSKPYLILRAVIVALLAMPISQNVYADMPVDEFLKFSLEGTSEQKKVTEFYIGGVGQGYIWANAAMDKQSLLFCFEGGMTTKDFFDMAIEASRLRKQNKSKGGGDVPVELVLLIHLQKLYPCRQ